ncbi:MAG: hypothetical protein KatS3mg031_1427 [Chitinophagales bacterium]|nr:MAG: hypothetical protein KatS3mg031_1427 [Chitinophagales bacterium]
MCFPLLRADKIGNEFGVQYIIKGAGDEYQRVAEVRATGAALVIPVNYPEAYDVEDPFDALNVNLADMKHWELAPYNPAILHAAGITFSLTATGLKDRNDFLPHVRKAVKNGLPKEAALKALTYTPAHLLGVSDKLGSLTEGSLANFIITSGDIFDEETAILENWIQGRKYVVNDTRPDNIDGTYRLQAGSLPFKMLIEGSPFKTKAQVVINDSVKNEVQFSRKDNLVTLVFNASASKDSTRIIRLSGLMEEKKWSGRGQLPDGSWVNWEATLEKAPEKKEKKSPSPAPAQPGKVFYPFTAYGYTEYPRQETVLIKNATVWTNEKEGILQHADVLIKDGKIAAVGIGLSDAAVRVIDATGKHVTSGIIDEHSHIAISGGVNEGSHASSAEVRIGDVVNSEDINIYRQLAGGVVVAQLLHGSANPIGGQSQIIKLRWGFPPEKMKLENAPQFIKFALGENVKRSNWEQPYLRYPQSRMGVEQIFEDYFTRAKEYLRLQGAQPGRPSKTKADIITPRRDLEMEALAEVLAGKRFITCHSYVQSEIVMLMRLAERLGFRVNTFTHILEGYKVADKMKAHGAKASTFSDWWAYKYEVIDAIPYNAALLIKSGVETAINSDDAEMGRRLNQEAAKTIKYGGLSEEEAWKTVTLYPARMLHIDNRTGSIKPGKDADIVIWSDHPLSVYTKAEKTFVDGICFYDIEKDKILRQEIAQERARLIQKMLEVKKAGEKTQKVASAQQRIYHCDDLEGYRD